MMERSRPSARTRLFLLLLCGLMAGAMFAGCGGGEKKAAPDDWVADICKGAETYSEQRSAALLTFFNVDSEDGQAMYAGLSQYTSTNAKSLESFAAAVKAAGVPDVQGGDKVAKAANQYAKQGQDDNSQAIKELAKLDKTSDTLASEVDDIFFEIDFADLRKLLKASGAADSDTIIGKFEAKSSCAFVLFPQDQP
ncbi:MAG: hypothetical protein ABI577_06070 [bacterium]